MSANTYVTKRLWRIGRQVLAGVAGAVVSTTGLTSAAIAAQQLAGFELLPALGQLDLVAAPAGAGTFADHDNYADAASLTDPGLKGGLQPGESAYFGYDLALRDGGATSTWVRMSPVTEGSDPSLVYEVRQTSDARQCRTLWATAKTVVEPRIFDGEPSEAFWMAPEADGGAAHLHLCIRVTLDARASTPEAGSVTWKFTAADK